LNELTINDNLERIWVKALGQNDENPPLGKDDVPAEI
jgi:hypothetical protein